MQAQQIAVQQDVDAHAGGNPRQRSNRVCLIRPQRQCDVGRPLDGGQLYGVAIGRQTPIRAVRTELRVQDRLFVLILCHRGIPPLS
ncbi:hypothetical protein D3C78_1501270 [compost metagenome]